MGTVKFNGELAYTYPLSGPEWDKLVSKSKFALGSDRSDATYAPDFGKFKTGKIALQDHSTDVKFRNIKFENYKNIMFYSMACYSIKEMLIIISRIF